MQGLVDVPAKVARLAQARATSTVVLVETNDAWRAILGFPAAVGRFVGLPNCAAGSHAVRATRSGSLGLTFLSPGSRHREWAVGQAAPHGAKDLYMKSTYGIQQLESRRKATSGRWGWIVILIVVLVAVVVCTGNAAGWCQTCQANANQAVADAGEGAFLCNYDCNTSGCGAASWTCHYNVCKPAPEDDTDTDTGNTGDGK